MRMYRILSFLSVLVFSASYADESITCPSTVTCTDSNLQNCTYSGDSNYDKWTPYAETYIQSGTYIFNSADFADSVDTRASGQVHRPECLYILQNSAKGTLTTSSVGLEGDTDILANIAPPSSWQYNSGTGTYKCEKGSLNLPPSACPLMPATTEGNKK